jgi:hypothetical protein
MFELLRLLNAHEVDYVLVGGLAVSLHGAVRMTLDVDVVVAMDDANLQRLMGAATATGLQPVAPVPLDSLAQPALLERWHREKNMLAFGLRSLGSKATVLDILVCPPLSYEELRADATLMQMNGYQLPVASIAHLIRLKTGTGRTKDILDIEALEQLSYDH